MYMLKKVEKNGLIQNIQLKPPKAEREWKIKTNTRTKTENRRQ